jgi:CSLREA domain-containing protein
VGRGRSARALLTVALAAAMLLGALPPRVAHAAGDIVVDHPARYFGYVRIGDTGQAVVNLLNQTTSFASVSAATATPFGILSNGCLELGPGQTCQITLTYTPTIGGTDNGVVQLSSNPAATFTPSDVIAVSGTGAFIVNSVNDVDDTVCDATHCSLREAINLANTSPHAVIAFNLPGTAPFAIRPLTPLPVVTIPTAIDGTSQPGWDGGPVIFINGENAGDTDGVVLRGGGSVVISLAIGNFRRYGITIDSTHNQLIGNYVGLDTTGRTAAANSTGGLYAGVGVLSGTANVIGQPNFPQYPHEINVISANAGQGIEVRTGAGVQITTNRIGTDSSGGGTLGNQVNGIYVGADGTMVDGNVIRNNLHGIGFGASGMTLTRNSIGANTGYGIQGSGSSNLISSNLISGNRGGGVLLGFPGATTIRNRLLDNDINGNGGDGILLRRDPVIDTTTYGNSIRNGLTGGITNNAGKGISLAFGANSAIPSPTVTSVQTFTGGLQVAGRAQPFDNVDIYADPSGQGATFLGVASADANGSWVKAGGWGDRDVTPFIAALRAHTLKVTATATDDSSNTSEFSAATAATPDALFGVNSVDDGLSRIDPATGAVTFISRLDPDVTKLTTPIAMAVRPSDGKIFVWNNTDGNTNPTIVTTGVLLTVDQCTGRAAKVNPDAGSQGAFDQLAFSPSGVLYLLGNGALYTVNQDTGQKTLVGVFGLDARIKGAAFDPATGVLYGVDLDGLSLYTINTTTGAATLVANLSQSVGIIGAIAVTPQGGLILSTLAGKLFDLDKSTGVLSNARSLAGNYAPQGMGFAPTCAETAIPNHKNHTWLTALPIVSGALQLDGLTKDHQSIWYRLPIQPQQRLRLDLYGLTKDYQLTVYRDLRKIARALGQVSGPQPPPIKALGRLLAGNISADTIDSDTIDSDTIDSDTIDSDTIDSDTIDSDTIDSDTIDSDTIDSDTIDSDTIDSDTIDSSGATDRGFGRVYETVQRRGLRAVSGNPGNTPETLIFNTRGLTGDLYIRIRGHFGAFDPANLFTFVAALTGDNSCVGADFTAQHPATPALALPTGKRTLILTNTASFDAAGAFATDATTLTLAAGISSSATTLTVNETIPGWRHTGWITVGGEVMHYTAFDQTTRTFTLDNRGDLSTPAAAHLAGAGVKERALTKPEFLAQLDLLAASTDDGTVFDIANDPGILAAWNTWRGKPDCAALANVMSDAVRELIASFQTRSPLEYLVLIGSDHVIPMRRVPDRAEVKREGDYDPPLKGSSEASLIGNWFLTDDFYGTTYPIARFDHDLYVPELATGRLVESVEDITAYIRAYREISGVAQPKRALASGYTFNSDLATYIADRLQSANGYKPADVDRLISDTWTAADMRAALFGTPRYGLYALNGHYNANRLQPADSSSLISSREIADVADGRFKGAVVESIGCHSGYDIVDADRAGNTQPVAFPEAWLSRGATLVGGTGYQYGETVVMKNTEELLAKLTQELGYANDMNGAAWADGVPIGKALRNAKLRYVNDLQSVRGLDEKIIGVSTLYGVPNLRVVMPVRAARSSTPIVLANPALDTRDDTQTFVIQGHPGTADFTLFPKTGPLGTYFVSGTATTPDPFGIGTEPYRPIKPRTVKNVEASNANVRGAVFMGGTYADQAHVPQLSVPATEDPGGAPTYSSSVFQPVRPLRLNDIGGQTLVVTPFSYRSDALGANGTARVFSQVKTRIYYSNVATTAGLIGAPEIRNIVLSRGGASTLRVEVTLAVQEAAGVTDVFVSYTGSQQPLLNTWTTTSMGSPVSTTRLRPANLALPAIATLRTYRFDVNTGPADAATAFVMIQAVGGFGDVAVASNNGAYYQLDETPAPPANRPDTTLQVSTPTSAAYRSKFNVTATLLGAGGTALPAGRLVKFTFGGQKVTKATDLTGNITATFAANVAPSAEKYPVTATFLADNEGLGSSVSADVLVTRAASGFTLTAPASLQYSDSAIVASLRATIPGVTDPAKLVLGETPVTVTVGTGVGARSIATQTDTKGNVRFDTLDFDGVLPGTYDVTLHNGGSEKYGAATDASFRITVDREMSVVTPAAFTPSPTGPITLRAQVTQTGPAPLDGTPGDLRNATVEWKLTPNVGAVVNLSAPVDATGASTITVTLPTAAYTIEAQAGGAYRSAVARATLAVFDATRAVAAAGKVSSPAGQVTTFGFATGYLAAPTLTVGTGGTLAAGQYRVGYSFAGYGLETAIGASSVITVGANGAINVAAIRNIPFDKTVVRFYIMSAPAGQPTGFAVERPVSNGTMAAFRITTKAAVASAPLTAPTGVLLLRSRDAATGATKATFVVIGTPGGFDWLVITGTPPTRAVFEGTGTFTNAAGVSSRRHYRVTVDKPANTFTIQIDDPANPATPLVISGTITPLPLDDDPTKSGIVFR